MVLIKNILNNFFRKYPQLVRWMADKQEIKIRPFKERDLQEVYAIERRSFPNPWPKFWFESLHLQNSADFLVASQNEDVLGYAIAKTEGKFKLWKLQVKEQGRLLKIAVKKEARHQGIGKSLLQAIIARLIERGTTDIWLEARTQNIGARKFYRAMGFEEKKIVDDYYKNGGDAIIMAKSF
ncbi:hypothetical protein AKJ45_01580 [candidate division MSBL1 archaeon SCGC-AAA261F19]|uniref:N-acetyltransferase domain-containing protein n=1 Tax=candidate division MSBL1 archaeon SCGC-AAA261F19 TaxID=1698275 RepID=A0A133VAI3_9EURY|nr:hypothetical protein AKJ45_01580 [candidate division MSBL1 archaeon SCGC-AAA261F19]